MWYCFIDGLTDTHIDIDLVRVRGDWHEVGARFRGFDQCSDDIDVVVFIVVGIPSFIPDYINWVLMI